MQSAAAAFPTQFARLLVWLAFLLVFGSQLGSLGPYLHESDQASILSGAWKLAHGETGLFHPDFYNFDKLYLTYGYLALWIGLFPQADPIWLGNLSSFLFFWLAFAAWLFFRPIRSLAQSVLILAILLAPAFWQHSAFLAAHFLSAGCLLTAALSWKNGSRFRQFLAAALAAGAVAMRADAILLLPLLAWILLPRRRPLRWLQNPWLWTIALGGVLALGIGRWIGYEKGASAFEFFFVPKVYAAYVIFGLGAGLAVALFWLAGWGKVAITRTLWWQKGFYLAGALAVLPYWTFYTFQMFSTRYWTSLLAMLAIGLLHRRTASLLMPRPSFAGLAALSLIGLAAIVPVFVGLNLNRLSHPQPVIGPGTPFPSADGNLTMGGYLPQAWKMQAGHFLHDHNQAIWLAARNAPYEVNSTGQIPFLYTPMYAYYELAATLKGRQAGQADAATAPFYYVDSRSMLRLSPDIARGDKSDANALLNDRKIEVVGESGHGYRMWKISPGTPDSQARESLALARLLNGNEFRTLRANSSENPKNRLGFRGGLFAPAPFELTLPTGKRAAAFVDSGGFYFLPIKAEEWADLPANELNRVPDLQIVLAIFPAYMAFEKL